jgi:hypothetical protein
VTTDFQGMTEAVNTWLQGEPKTFFSDGIKKLVGQENKHLKKQEDYVKKLHYLFLSLPSVDLIKEIKNNWPLQVLIAFAF